MTAAKGAESFYQIDDNPVRSEGIEAARQIDSLTIESWIGHPYIDVIDNSMANFDMKMAAMIEVSYFNLVIEFCMLNLIFFYLFKH